MAVDSKGDARRPLISFKYLSNSIFLLIYNIFIIFLFLTLIVLIFVD